MNPGPPSAAPWWLPGPTGQTLWSRLVRSRRMVRFSREILPTPDGDEVMLDHLDGPAGAPRVILLHGLEGSAYSWHAQGLAVLVAAAGWGCTALNFRSCARDPQDLSRRIPNRRPRLYHSGDTADLDLVVRTLRARDPAVRLCAVGFSLGGNVLIKYLGEQGAEAQLHAAATLSVPYDLAAASRFLERPASRLYAHHFLRRLRPKALELLARFPAETAHLDAARIRAARTFCQFDDCVTAPLHGFDSAAHYYDRASALGFLSRVATPTLCISAEDDPFFPREGVARARAVASSRVRFQVTAWGGHTGFVGGRWPWRPWYWAEEMAIGWLARAV